MNDSTIPIIGYIEGYYGRILRWSERCRVVDALSRHAMTAYLYAPKEDLRHRLNWREPYDAGWFAEFSAFCLHARLLDIEIMAGIAPGLDFNFNHLEGGPDFNVLVEKSEQLLSEGASCIVLLMDDIDEKFHERHPDYPSEGAAHAMLANRLGVSLGQRIFVAPRVYSDEIGASEIGAGEIAGDESLAGKPDYQSAFGSQLDAHHVVFHCGKKIVADSISCEEFSAIRGRQQRIVVWDNLYANDYCPRRLFLGPWRGREQVRDIMLNPTGMIETDLLLLDIMASTGDLPIVGGKVDLSSVYARHEVPQAFLTVSDWFDLPPFQFDGDLSFAEAGREQFDALESLLWKWKTPLSREWYPYLLGLKQDLLYMTNNHPRDRIMKTQTPVVAKAMLEKQGMF